jgi:hypothetical protein
VKLANLNEKADKLKNETLKIMPFPIWDIKRRGSEISAIQEELVSIFSETNSIYTKSKKI